MINNDKNTNDDFFKVVFDDLDPDLLEDPILLLKWLDQKPQSCVSSQLVEEPRSTNTEKEPPHTSRSTPRKKELKDTDSLDFLFLDANEDATATEDFSEWLVKKVSSESKQEIMQAFEIIEEYAYKYKLISGPLLNTYNIATIRNIQNLLVQKKEFRTMDANKRYICGLALRQYIQFLSEQQPKRTPTLLAAESASTMPSNRKESYADIEHERDERARRWAASNQRERELLEKERQLRAHKWAAKKAP